MNSIRERLTKRMLVAGIVLSLLGSGIAYFLMGAALTRQFDDALRTKALALSAIIEQDSTGIQVDLGDPFLREFDADKTNAFFELWRAGGGEVARSESLGGEALKISGPANAEPNFSDAKLASGVSARTVQFKFKPHPADAQDEKESAEAILCVAVDRSDLNRTLTTIAFVLEGLCAVMLLLMVVAVPAFLRKALAPLNDLAERAKRIGPENLSERFPVADLPEEISPITVRLNDLLQRLEAAFGRERQFSDDLAHEFRTPIAELRSLAELALKWPAERDPQTDRQVLAIAEQMQNIINRLLAIARNERGPVEAELQTVSLNCLLSKVIEPFRSRAAARGLKIELEIPSAMEIKSDPVLLRSIISNLVENAVEYSAAGTVLVQCSMQSEKFTFCVSNPAPNLAQGDISNLFERFWRKDSARSGSEHAGLGLSLTRVLAQSLGYELSAELNDKSLLIMTLKGAVTCRVLEKILSKGQQA